MPRRFAFRLATLLRVRELREREAQRKVGAKQAEIARVELARHQTAREINRYQDMLRGSQPAGHLDPAGMARIRAWMAHLRRQTAEQATLRTELMRQLDGLLAEFRHARMRRKMLEKLRDRRFDEYRHDCDVAEQAELDELAQHLHGLGAPAGEEPPCSAGSTARSL